MAQTPLNCKQMDSLYDVFKSIKDPRRRRDFPLAGVFTIVAMALLCGYEDIAEIQRFGTRLSQRQREALCMPQVKPKAKTRRVPSYMVYYSLLKRVDANHLAEKLTQWLQHHQDTLPKSLAVDGKMIRDRTGIVTFCDHENGNPVALGVIEKKGKELTKTKELINTGKINLEGEVISGDALHCTRQAAHEIVQNQGGDYLFQVKNNNAQLNRTLKKTFKKKSEKIITTQSLDYQSGRIETRTIEILSVDTTQVDFPHVRQIIKARTETYYKTRKKQPKPLDRYYVCSVQTTHSTPQQMLQNVRKHWSIEIKNHWKRDCCWKEDRSRLKHKNIMANLALIRSGLLVLLNQAKKHKIKEAIEIFRADTNQARKIVIQKLTPF